MAHPLSVWDAIDDNKEAASSRAAPSVAYVCAAKLRYQNGCEFSACCNRDLVYLALAQGQIAS